MAQNARVAFSLLILPAVLALIPAAAARDAGRCRPPLTWPHRPSKPDKNYKVRVIGVDAGDAAVPLVSAILAGTSNREDQIARLRDAARRGTPILRVTCYPGVSAKHNDIKTSTRENQEEMRLAESGTGLTPATRSRVTAHPHVNEGAWEAVEISVEQAPAGAAWRGPVIHTDLNFANGDTKLLNDTRTPDGIHHLLYATVFYPPPPL